MKKKILVGLLAVLILIQFYPVTRDNPATNESETFFASANVPDEIQGILNKACMDCHSHKTTYPWYSYVAPFSIFIGHHVEEGREHLNLSAWNTYSLKRKDHKLEELIEEVEEGEMPLSSYTWLHSEAKLSEEEREELINWIKQLRSSLPIEE